MQAKMHSISLHIGRLLKCWVLIIRTVSIDFVIGTPSVVLFSSALNMLICLNKSSHYWRKQNQSTNAQEVENENSLHFLQMRNFGKQSVYGRFRFGACLQPLTLVNSALLIDHPIKASNSKPNRPKSNSPKRNRNVLEHFSHCFGWPRLITIIDHDNCHAPVGFLYEKCYSFLLHYTTARGVYLGA